MSLNANPRRPTATLGYLVFASSNVPGNSKTQPWSNSSWTKRLVVSGSTSAECQFAKCTDNGVSGSFGRSFGPKVLDGEISSLKPVLKPSMRL